MFRTEITPDGVLRHVAIGPVTIDSVAAAYRAWIDDPQFDPFLPVMWDLRGQSMEIAAQDFMRFPQRTNRLTGKQRAGLRSAIVVDNRNAEFVANTVCMSPEWAVEFLVCRQEREALEWLGVAGRT